MTRADPAKRVPALQRCASMALVSVAALAGCASSSPPPALLHLPLALPGLPAATPAASAPGPVYQLVLPLRIPEYLDRSEVLIAQGASLVPLPGYRWAEPLREAMPRLLRADLEARLGPGRVWSAPLPPGLVVHRQWRVEVLAFDIDSARPAVRLRAQWSMAELRSGGAPRSGSVSIEAAAAGASAPALAAAHRAAIARLAEQLVAALP